MRLGQIGGYDIPYFSKGNLLTKNHIIEQFNNDYELSQYLPDSVNRSTITRSFLLSLLYNIRKDKYLYLYNIYKKQKANKSYFNGKVYEINITPDYAKNIQQYSPTSK